MKSCAINCPKTCDQDCREHLCVLATYGDQCSYMLVMHGLWWSMPKFSMIGKNVRGRRRDKF